MKNTSTWLVYCAAVFILWQNVTFANDQLKLTIGSWTFEDYKSHNLSVSLQLTQQGLKVNATADTIELREPIGTLTKVTLQCTELVLLSGQTNCVAGKIGFIHKKYGLQSIAFSVKAMTEQGRYLVSISNLKFADATFNVKADSILSVKIISAP